MAAAVHMRSWGEGSAGSMDGRLWGRLQDHIDLAMVYAKLPIGDFFRLRAVCKEWNWLASDQEFLNQNFTRPISSPYFVMASWLLYYEHWARRWSWTWLPKWDCAVGGLLYREGQVFNVHTRVFHEVPSTPEPEDDQSDEEEVEHYPFDPVVGMTVARSAAGRYSFQVILGEAFVDTQVYSSDSGDWSQVEDSTHIDWQNGQSGRAAFSRWTCAEADGILYLRKWLSCGENPRISTYNLEGGCWESHGRDWELGKSELGSLLIYDIGAWQGRVFLFGLMLEDGRFIVTARELRPEAEPEWVTFDQMPDDVCMWMFVDEIRDAFGDNKVIQMETRFSGEYVLVYVSVTGVALERAVLYNLKHETWEKVEVPGPWRPSSLQLLVKEACSSTGRCLFYQTLQHKPA